MVHDDETHTRDEVRNQQQWNIAGGHLTGYVGCQVIIH